FDETVIDTYNQWVVRRTWKEGRHYRNHWQSEWDYDDYFNLKSNTDYVMGDDGKLFDPNKPPKTNGDTKEELRKSIRDRERKIQEDQKKLEEDKNKLSDSANKTISSIDKGNNNKHTPFDFPM